MTRASGTFLLRISPALHARLRDRAARQGVSLNRLCASILEVATDSSRAASALGSEGALPPLSLLAERCRSVFGEDLLGLVLFGSIARGEAFPESDVDLLVVMAGHCPLRRALYERWAREIEARDQERVGREVSPHFCHLPASPEDAGGLWFEVSIDGAILWERDGAVSRHLRAIRRYLASGGATRRVQHGHGYWVRQRTGTKKIPA